MSHHIILSCLVSSTKWWHCRSTFNILYSKYIFTMSA